MTTVTVLCCVALYMCSLPCLAYLQGKSYHITEYFTVLKSRYFLLIVLLQFAFAVLFALNRLWAGVICVCVTLPLGIVFAVKIAKSNKPMKFTFRMILTSAALCCVITAVCLVFPVGVALLPFAVAFSHIVLLPLESAIGRYYISKARKKLHASNVVTIAVTGSFGKTSVKQILSQLLNCNATPSSYNTPLGIARYINGNAIDSRYIVLEFGARRRGDISKLCRLFPPDVGVITGVTDQHLETFKSLDNIVYEKGCLIDSLTESSFCVIGSVQNTESYRTRGKCRKVYVGTDGLSFDIVKVENNEMHFVVHGDNDVDFQCPLLGVANVQNIVCALEVCRQLGYDISQFKDSVKGLLQIDHRMQLINTPHFDIIDDSYNANINGVASCCTTLDMLRGAKVAISQGIVEGGSQQRQLNVQCGRLLGASCRLVVVVGVNSNSIAEGVALAGGNVVFADSTADAVKTVNALDYKVDYLLFQNDIPEDCTKI